MKDSATTAQEVTDAAEALNTAVATYNEAKANGTKVVVLDKTEIDTAITSANVAKTNVVISADGTDVEPTSRWVTQAVNSALDAAIEVATSAKDSATTAQQVTSVAEVLNTAVAKYNAAKADGTKVVVDMTAIDTAITSANAAKTNVVISADGTDAEPTSKWVTQEANNALDAEIATATSAKSSVKTAQEVTDAAKALNTAVATYNEAKADGTKVVVVNAPTVYGDSWLIRVGDGTGDRGLVGTRSNNSSVGLEWNNVFDIKWSESGTNKSVTVLYRIQGSTNWNLTNKSQVWINNLSDWNGTGKEFTITVNLAELNAKSEQTIELLPVILKDGTYYQVKAGSGNTLDGMYTLTAEAPVLDKTAIDTAIDISKM